MQMGGNHAAWFMQNAIIQYLSWVLQPHIFRIPKHAYDLNAFSPESWTFMDAGQRELFTALVKCAPPRSAPDWWEGREK
jgi:hypothetical protein